MERYIGIKEGFACDCQFIPSVHPSLVIVQLCYCPPRELHQCNYVRGDVYRLLYTWASTTAGWYVHRLVTYTSVRKDCCVYFEPSQQQLDVLSGVRTSLAKKYLPPWRTRRNMNHWKKTRKFYPTNTSLCLPFSPVFCSTDPWVFDSFLVHCTCGCSSSKCRESSVLVFRVVLGDDATVYTSSFQLITPPTCHIKG